MTTRFLGSLVVNTLFFVVLILGPAWLLTGRWDWARGWFVVAVLFVTSAVGGLWLVVKDPDLVRERMSFPQATSREDARATLLIVVLVVGWIVGAVVDALRLQLLPAPPPAVSLGGGLGLYLLGFAFVMWVFGVNSFAAPVVKIQNERHQHVIDTGPYAIVRHPMYLGASVFLAGMVLMLGSTAFALLSLPVLIVGFLPRILVEEETLRRELPGYAAYLSRVRYRILPGVW